MSKFRTTVLKTLAEYAAERGVSVTQLMQLVEESNVKPLLVTGGKNQYVEAKLFELLDRAGLVKATNPS